MNRNAKRISSRWSAEISRIRGYIRESNGRGFDGDGYAFRQALKLCREQEGMTIVYSRKTGMYYVK